MTTTDVTAAPTPTPRVVLTRRYEFTLSGDHRTVDFDDLVAARDHALAWLRTVPLEPDPADVVVRYAHDQRLVVSYEEPPLVDEVGVVTSVTTLRDELREALDAHYEAPWAQLLDVVRNRTALASVAARTVRAVNDRDGGDGLVLALLPRDWPRRLDAQLANAGNQLGLVGLIKRLLDDWVLAAQDVVDATRPEVDRDVVA